MLILQIYYLLAFSICYSIEEVLLIRKDSREGFADKSKDKLKTDVKVKGAKLKAQDTKV